MNDSSINRSREISTNAPIKPWEKRDAVPTQTVQQIQPSTTNTNVLPTNSSNINTYNPTSSLTTGSTYNMPNRYNTRYGSMYSPPYYNNMNTYNTGYGYNSGYGSSMYSNNIYGNMYGRPPMQMDMNGNMISPEHQFGWLSSFHQIISSIGQVTDLLGMNAEALNFCITSLANFIERLVVMCSDMATSLSKRPVFPPGHPRYGEPPPTEEEERQRLRRVRIFKFVVSLIILTFLYKGLRWIKRVYNRSIPLITRVNPKIKTAELEQIFQHASRQ